MRRHAVLLGLGLGFAFTTLAADEGGEAAPKASPAPAPAVEKPRGTCHFTKPGISLIVEDTTKDACHERQVQCQQDNPGHEAECRSQWTASAEKPKPARKAKRAAERPASAPAEK